MPSVGTDIPVWHGVEIALGRGVSVARDVVLVMMR